MGTHCKISIYNEQNNHLLSLYCHYDGYYKGGVGEELENFLKPFNVVNGLSGNQDNVANGMSCLALQIVTLFKKRPGNVYVTSENVEEEYNYEVRYKDGKAVFIQKS
jgi:hypothetical protein